MASCSLAHLRSLRHSASIFTPSTCHGPLRQGDSSRSSCFSLSWSLPASVSEFTIACHCGKSPCAVADMRSCNTGRNAVAQSLRPIVSRQSESAALSNMATGLRLSRRN